MDRNGALVDLWPPRRVTSLRIPRDASAAGKGPLRAVLFATLAAFCACASPAPEPQQGEVDGAAVADAPGDGLGVNDGAQGVDVDVAQVQDGTDLDAQLDAGLGVDAGGSDAVAEVADTELGDADAEAGVADGADAGDIDLADGDALDAGDVDADADADADAKDTSDAKDASDTKDAADTKDTSDAQDADSGPPDTCGCATDADCQSGPSKPCQAKLCQACQCAVVPMKEGAPCDDGDPCSGSDTCAAGVCKPGKDVCAPTPPAGLGQSPCKVVGSPPSPKKIKLVKAFPNIAFNWPIELTTPRDGKNHVAVVERAGRILVFPNDDAVQNATVLLDIVTKISTAGEGGLLSAAFHPNYGSNRQFYVNYTTKGAFQTIVSRFQVPVEGGKAPTSSELVLLNIAQPYSNHNGGQVAFDNFGKLIIGMGDGGGAGDPLNAGQDFKTFLGAMLRIDVDAPSAGKPYGIPSDNPKKPGWLPEIWAIGMRNPWRFSVDAKTGKVWVADVGQGKWEEVDIVVGGGNYGWKVMEGNHCYSPTTCDPKLYDPPIFEYGHNLGTSITGGHVYRGSKNPSLAGRYVVADYGSGRFWALTPNDKGGVDDLDLGVMPTKPVDIGEDEQGELYSVQLFGTTIHRIVEDLSESTTPTPPATLSQTGCFSDLAKLTPAPGLLRYELNAPLWSDGSAKARWIVLPGDGAVPVAPQKMTLPTDDLAAATLPIGSLVIKHFALGTAPIGQAGSVPVETRFMRRDAAGWVFLTYRWRADGKDADLVHTGSAADFALPAGGKQTWHQPSVDQCKTCHQGPNGAEPLGLSAAQWNRLVGPPAKPQQQLALFAAWGLLSGYAGDPAKHGDLPPQDLLPNTTDPQSVDAHARTWLHVQCASCHRPGGSSQAALDLRTGAPLSASKACDVTPAFGDLGLADARVIAPGKPQASVLLARVQSPPGSAVFMPQLGVSVVQPQAAKLLETWISQLKGCP